MPKLNWKQMSHTLPHTYRANIIGNIFCRFDIYDKEFQNEFNKISGYQNPIREGFWIHANVPFKGNLFESAIECKSPEEAKEKVEQMAVQSLRKAKEKMEKDLQDINYALEVLTKEPVVLERRGPRKKGYYIDFFPLFKIPECLLTWEDLSYHNAQCPANGITIGDKRYFMFVDFEDKERREEDDIKRFRLYSAYDEEYNIDPESLLFETDSEEELEKYLNGNVYNKFFQGIKPEVVKMVDEEFDNLL